MEAEGTAVKVASMMVALADVAATRLHELDASLSSSLCLYLHLCLSPSLVLSRGGFQTVQFRIRHAIPSKNKMSGIIHMCERLTTTTPASPGQRHL